MASLLIAAAGTLTAATQSKYESLGTAAFLIRLRAAELLAIADGATFQDVMALPGKANVRLTITRSSTSLFMQVRDSTFGSTALQSFLRSALPGSGFVNLYGLARDFAVAGGGTTRETAIYDGTTLLASITETANYGALATGAGTGAITIGGASAECVDAAYVFNRALSAGERTTQPTAGMSGLIGGYEIAEGSGSTTADLVSGGTALTLTSATWDAAGDWNTTGGAGSVAGALRRRRMMT